MLKSSFIAATLLIATYTTAVELPHTFSTGQAALAEEVNANFSALAQATTANADTLSGTSFGAEYILDASTSGAKSLRNVIVLKHDKGGTGTCNEHVYRFRIAFDNTENEPVETPSGTVIPERIWIDGRACAARDNPTVANFFRVSNFALPITTNDPGRGFSQVQGLEINGDSNGDGSIDINGVRGYRETRTSSPLANSELVHSVIFMTDESNNINSTINFSYISSIYEQQLVLGGPINTPFDDVMMRSYVDGKTRLQAKNIGLVYEGRPGEAPAKAIYYRIGGQPVGSLADTPFVGSVSGLWFTP